MARLKFFMISMNRNIKKYLLLPLFLALLFVSVFGVAVKADDSLVVSVGIYENSPKIFTDDQGNASGFWPDIIEYIASEEGWEIEYIHGTWAQCLERLENNEIDVMPDVAYSEDRNRLFDFSNEAVYISWSRVYAKEGIDIQSVIDLEGKTIAVLEGSINYEGPDGIKQLVASFNVDCTFMEVDSYTRVFELVDSGEVDLGVSNRDFYNQNKTDYDIIPTPIVFQPSSLYFAFPRNSILTPYLIERIDYHINELRTNEDSIYYQSLGKWLGITPIEKSIIPEWIKWSLIGSGVFLFILLGGSFILRSQVRTRTKELAGEVAERKKAEEKYSTLVEQSNDGIIIIQDGLLKFVNKKMLEIAAFLPDEVIDKPFIDFVSPEYKSIVIDNYQRRISGKEVRNNYEIEIIAKDGSYVPFEINASRIEYEGRPADMAILRNITERKRAEEILRQSEERYRDLFDNSNDLIQSILPDGHFLYVNNAWRDILGYSEEEVAKLKVWDIIHPDSINHCMEAFQKVMSGESINDIEAVFVARDGHPVAVEGNAHCRYIDGKPGSTQGIFRDVTGRKLAEDRVAHLNSMLRALRNVNQLITREPEGERLIQQSCELILEARGFITAWILLFDGKKKYISAAMAGGEDVKAAYLNQLKQGDYPPCITQILKQKEPFAVCDDIVEGGMGCLPRGIYSEGKGLISRLEYEGTIYGVLSVYVPSNIAYDEEEQSLFRELAGDISYALAFIEKQEEIHMLARFPNENPSPVLRVAKDGTILYANKASLPLLEKWSRKVGQVLDQQWHRYILEALDTGAVRSIEVGCDNRIFLVRFAPLKEANYVNIYGLDITEQKQTQEALSESEGRYRTLFESAGEGILIADIETKKFKYTNPAICRMLGYSKEELLKMGVNDIHPKDSLEQVFAEFEAQAKGKKLLSTLPCLKKDGTIIYVDINATKAIIDGKWCNVGFFSDITERKIIEELRISKATAETANKTKSEFLSSMSHELRTPLNAVLGFSQVLQEQYYGKLNQKQSEYVKNILDSGNHLLSLINDILDLSKIEAGKEELQLSKVNIKNLLQNSLVMIREKAFKHNIKLDLKTAMEIDNLAIKADERKLKQIMYNFLSNAAKFTPDGGSITVEARKDKTDIIISVTDTGIGISLEDQEKIFKSFYQVKGGITGKTPGTGLGLPLTRRLVELHGGRIWVESRGEGKGSRFSFSIPLAVSRKRKGNKNSYPVRGVSHNGQANTDSR